MRACRFYKYLFVLSSPTNLKYEENLKGQPSYMAPEMMVQYGESITTLSTSCDTWIPRKLRGGGGSNKEVDPI